ncbi:hypothetical protein BHE74_00003805 [Ensete ventricosum]|nr:hypothetical protein GW17_00038425 [Ensete ventricosum]RWW87372.1 hypothetical protein BHE74_00003805 [Ensete ventricosum]RZS04271.1 hypothetical protein BHM03_00034581 [Ensete ventricosum]
MSIAMVNRPWVMISVNDDKEDLHFRKAGIALRAITYVRDPSTTTKLLQRSDVDAIEIHTSGRFGLFCFPQETLY